jgi:hypothetical protein
VLFDPSRCSVRSSRLITARRALNAVCAVDVSIGDHGKRDYQIAEIANATFIVDDATCVWDGLIRSPAGSVRRLIARVLCQRQHPIVHDKTDLGLGNNQCGPVLAVSRRSSPARSRCRENSPPKLRRHSRSNVSCRFARSFSLSRVARKRPNAATLTSASCFVVFFFANPNKLSYLSTVVAWSRLVSKDRRCAPMGVAPFNSSIALTPNP